LFCFDTSSVYFLRLSLQGLLVDYLINPKHVICVSECKIKMCLANLLSSSLLWKNLKIKIYRTIILPFLYGCETWSLTLREERRLRVFESRVLTRIFGSKGD
jgi:hypothetical protein